MRNTNKKKTAGEKADRPPKARRGVPTAQEIILYLQEHPEAPRKPRRLARRMGVADEDYPGFRRLFQELRAEGAVTSSSAQGEIRVGRFVAKERGYGFVRLSTDGERREEDLFIPLGRTAGAMTGDLVSVRLGRRRGRPTGPGAEGEVIQVLERGTAKLVGTTVEAGGAWFVEPDGRKLTTPVLLADVAPGELDEGAKVVVELVEYPRTATAFPVGVVTEVLGREGQLDVEIEAILRGHEIPSEHGGEAREEARGVLEKLDAEIAAAREHRVDLTALTTVTIDPVDARDFDDAISLVERDDGLMELGVHIADVSHFVSEGGALDREARERGTSVYFPRRVVPMLPLALSAGACALRPNSPRLALSVLITYDAEGQVVRRRIERSIIESKQRLTYAEAQRICEGRAEGATPEITDLLQRMLRLSRAIHRRRTRAGMLDLELTEISLDLDQSGRVRDAHPASNEETHRVIEMFMVEANEAVAAALTTAGAPLMRRIHPPPTGDGWERLREFSALCGLELDRGGPSHRSIQRLLSEASRTPQSVTINLAVLRSLQRASYSLRAEGHFALASDAYCHFTSPIRRYPDLVVHRLVHRVLLDGRPADRDDETIADLESLAEHCSETERRAEAAEQELELVLVLQFLAGRVGERFTGVVTGVTRQGIFVQMPRFLVEGLVPRARLGSGWWEVDSTQGRLSERETGDFYQIGDVVQVAIAGVDVARRHLDLQLAGRRRGSSGRRRPRGRSAPRPREHGRSRERRRHD